MDGTTVVDISTATTKSLLLYKPDRTLLTKAASFSTDGTDGKIRYTTLAADLSAAGSWQLQVYIEMPTGKWHSDVQAFHVYANLT